MQSAFEHNAQRAAVKAVEDRLAHNDRVRKQASRRRTLSALGGWLVGLAILAAIGYWFYGRLEEQPVEAQPVNVRQDSAPKEQRPKDKAKANRNRATLKSSPVKVKSIR